MSYEREYKIIDEILEGASRPTSPFTAKDGASMLDTLFERAGHIPIWILSLGNAVVGIEELEAKMAKHGRQTKAIALKYQHLPAVATEEKKRENREFLVVGWDPNAPLLRGLSVDRVGLGDRLTGTDEDRPVPGVHVDPGPSGPKRPTAESFPVDGLQKLDPPVTEQAAPPGRGLTVPELQPRVDGPDAVLGESGVGGDGEGRVVTLGAHGRTFP